MLEVVGPTEKPSVVGTDVNNCSRSAGSISTAQGIVKHLVGLASARMGALTDSSFETKCVSGRGVGVSGSMICIGLVECRYGARVSRHGKR